MEPTRRTVVTGLSAVPLLLWHHRPDHRGGPKPTPTPTTTTTAPSAGYGRTPYGAAPYGD